MIIRKRGRKAKCPYCASQHTIRKGIRKTTGLGDRPLRVCRDCGRKFTVGLRNKPSKPLGTRLKE